MITDLIITISIFIAYLAIAVVCVKVAERKNSLELDDFKFIFWCWPLVLLFDLLEFIPKIRFNRWLYKLLVRKEKRVDIV